MSHRLLVGYASVSLAVFAALWLLLGEPSHSSGVLGRNPYGRVDLCRATIAAVMGSPIDIIRPDSGDGSVVHTVYGRGDGTVWRNKCKFTGNSIVWAARDGRWRDRRDWDEAIAYEVDAATRWLTLTLSYPDGSAGKKTFSPYEINKPPS
jgi:hypothetical protein